MFTVLGVDERRALIDDPLIRLFVVFPTEKFDAHSSRRDQLTGERTEVIGSASNALSLEVCSLIEIVRQRGSALCIGNGLCQ